MSHFPVLVVVPDGKTLEEVMMPYHEFECTGIDKYIQEVDITGEVVKQIEEEGTLEDALGYFGLEDRVVSDEGEVDRLGPHKCGYAIVVDGKLIKAIDRTNPNKKWDWYVVGGRWSKFFGRDEGTKNQFNLEKVRMKIIRDKVSSLSDFQIKRNEVSVTVNDINSAKELLEGRWSDYKEAHEFYKHPVELAFDRETFKALDRYSWGVDDAKDMRLDSNQYTLAHEYDALLHAFIDADGKWNEVGDMGWWGMCSDENKDTFNGKDGAFWKFINGLSDDAMLYVVDCHI